MFLHFLLRSIGCTIIEMLTCKPPWSDMEPMSAVYNIGSGRKSPEMPSNLSKALRNFLLQTFKRLVAQDTVLLFSQTA